MQLRWINYLRDKGASIDGDYVERFWDFRRKSLNDPVDGSSPFEPTITRFKSETAATSKALFEQKNSVVYGKLKIDNCIEC